PQRHQAWLAEVTISLKRIEQALRNTALMLILDVKTRWSSMHQMLRCALDYRDVIDNFVAKNRELRSLKLSTADWDAIALVTKWLKSFQSATTQMSTTKCSMLSSTHAIFRGLQEDIRNSLAELPDGAPVKLKTSLMKAHRKLSDYYTKLDESPYYIWSSLLDPRISYQGLLADCGDDISLKSHLELAKECLTAHINELEEFWKLPQEDFENCDPVQWWAGRRAQFPSLSRQCNPIGSAVAVERIFSGGRDTISLRRASLQPETIRTLMLVKQRLRLARSAIQEI
ncbi:hypothetical protein PILCRDRAFT_55234, partial [Piloderma croceum F 1598]